jgi:hypothetical protein
MKAIVRASQEKKKACLKSAETCAEDMGADQEKSEAKMEAIAEHCKWVPCIKIVQVLTTMRGQAYDVFHGAPEGAMYEETIGATKD